MDDNIKYITVSEQKFKEIEELAELGKNRVFTIRVGEAHSYTVDNALYFIPMYSFDFSNASLPKDEDFRSVELFIDRIRVDQERRVADIKKRHKELIEVNAADSNKLYLIPMWIRKIFGAV